MLLHPHVLLDVSSLHLLWVVFDTCARSAPAVRPQCARSVPAVCPQCARSAKFVPRKEKTRGQERMEGGEEFVEERAPMLPLAAGGLGEGGEYAGSLRP